VKDLRFVRETLLELDPTLLDPGEEETYQAALILLSSLICGPDASDLAAFTGLPLSLVTTIRRRMITAELWSETTVCLDAWYREDGGFWDTHFWMDVFVAQGLVVRRWMVEEDEYRYFAKELDPVGGYVSGPVKTVELSFLRGSFFIT